jgi:hypothetical protein
LRARIVRRRHRTALCNAWESIPAGPPQAGDVDEGRSKFTGAQSAGVALAGLFVKAGYFRLALGLLAELRTVAESGVFRLIIEFVTAKLHLKANRFEIFYATLPPIDVSSVQTLAASVTALFNARTFDVAFASLKFWAEAMVNAIQSATPRELGRGHYFRGCAPVRPFGKMQKWLKELL